MSNRASLRRTKFTGEGNDIGWGWHICDDYFRSYSDGYKEKEVPENPLDLLKTACTEATVEERLLFENLLAFERGLLINGSWHEFEKIESALRAGLDKED
jgi:hypothetical protein